MTLNGVRSKLTPTDQGRGSHTVTLTPTFYIYAVSFRSVDNDPSFYGLAPDSTVPPNVPNPKVISRVFKIVGIHCCI